MRAREEVDRLRSVRSAVAEAEEILLHPIGPTFAVILPRLEEAARLLTAMERDASHAYALDVRAELRNELKLLRRDLKRVSALVEGAAEMQAGWAHLLALAMGGYSASGAVVAMQVSARISLEA